MYRLRGEAKLWFGWFLFFFLAEVAERPDLERLELGVLMLAHEHFRGALRGPFRRWTVVGKRNLRTNRQATGTQKAP